MGIRRTTYDTFPCACCALWTLTDPASGSYEICPVCSWEDDPVQNADPSYEGGANGVSLVDARKSYMEIGASEQRLLQRVRTPRLNEIPHWFSSPDPQIEKAIQRGLKSTILELARTLLAEQRELLENSSAIAWLSSGLDEHERQAEHFLIFRIVASELDEFPVGAVRTEWAPAVLAQKDEEVATYLATVLPEILSACRAIERCLDNAAFK